MKLNDKLFAHTPLRIIKVDDVEIPVFSESDSYIENYEKISLDHVNHMEMTGDNPFMAKRFWAASEDQTRSLLTKYLNEGGRVCVKAMPECIPSRQ